MTTIAIQLKRFLSVVTILSLTLPCYVHAKTKRRARQEEEFSVATEYIVPFLKVSLACSPIIIIVGMLMFAREDEETEKEKIEEAKKAKCIKS